MPKNMNCQFEGIQIHSWYVHAIPTDRIQLGLHDMAITTFLFLSEILRTQTTKKEMSSSSKLRRQWCDSSRNGIKLFLKEHSITKLNLTLLVKFNSIFFSNSVCFSERPTFISKQISIYPLRTHNTTFQVIINHGSGLYWKYPNHGRNLKMSGYWCSRQEIDREN